MITWSALRVYSMHVSRVSTLVDKRWKGVGGFSKTCCHFKALSDNQDDWRSTSNKFFSLFHMWPAELHQRVPYKKGKWSSSSTNHRCSRCGMYAYMASIWPDPQSQTQSCKWHIWKRIGNFRILPGEWIYYHLLSILLTPIVGTSGQVLN